MLAALLCAFVLVSASETVTIFDGAFTPAVVEGRIKDSTLFLAFAPAQCVEKFSVVATEETPFVVETIRGHDDSGFKWVDISDAARSGGLSESPYCASRFRITISAGEFLKVTADVTGEDGDARERRAITCRAVDAGKWPTQCQRAPDGAYCLPSAFCGCLVDADCYSSTVNPYCDPTTQVCNYCTFSDASLTNQHYFCRERIPSRYAADGALTPAPASVPSSENVPLFAEVCNGDEQFMTIGSCERCDQANFVNVPNGVPFPDYQTIYPGITEPEEEYVLGHFFCGFIRGSTSPTPSRPQCISGTQWDDWGLTNEFSIYTVTMEIAWAGSGSGPYTDPAIQNKVVTRTMADWEGACAPCLVQDGSGNDVRLHEACSKSRPTTPICGTTTAAGCGKCQTNEDCALGDTPHTGFFTGGANCMADGSCQTCLTNTDCGIGVDGGTPKDQTICNVASGLCTSPILCNANFGEAGTQPCTAALPNCNADGSCISCNTNGNCGTTDGGTTSGQQVCDVVSHTCVDCEVNADCVGTSGANCQKSGLCVNCGPSPNTVCGTNDGGAPAGGCNPSPNGFCADDSDQSICNTQTNQCEDPCLGNNYCGDKSARQPGVTTNNGANCNSDGTCANCQTPGSANDIPNSPNCGNKDGPPNIPGATGTAGQTLCTKAGICSAPFTCTENTDCDDPNAGTFTCTSQATATCANCQVGGSCVPCVVTYQTSTCGAGNDAGTPSGQPNCQQNTRYCIDKCTNDAYCTNQNTQGTNCMKNGVCLDCRSDADCVTTAPWGGDNDGATLCNTVTKLCEQACNGNFGSGTSNPCPTSGNPNCMKDGRCAPCSATLDCPNNDGPPGQPASSINTICGANGICIDPFKCSPASSPGDNQGCKNSGQGNNCMKDLTCKTCTSNADCVNDGGFKPDQPKCDTVNGVCIECASNADCPGVNCNEDGRCSDCNLFTAGTTCENHDGPPNTNHINPNCDPITKTCVDFCTNDDQCTDACAPHCQLDRGCCVECNDDGDCPLDQWRGDVQTQYTKCSSDFICVLPYTDANCETDDDCNTAGRPACSATENKCVECLYDSHCSGATPACDTGLQKCVGCTSDYHCQDVQDDNGDPTSCDVETRECAGAGMLAVSLFAIVMLLVSHLF